MFVRKLDILSNLQSNRDYLVSQSFTNFDENSILSIKFINLQLQFFLLEKRTSTRKKPRSSSYDDTTLESMKKYYKVEDNYDSLLKYIKTIGLRVDDQELV